MSNSQMHLHSENFDLCRICLLEPETNRHIKFIHIFGSNNGGLKLNQQMIELLGIKVEKDDIKPKIICENCHKSLMSWIEMKKKAAESQIVINYIATKKFGVAIPGTSNASYSSPNSRNKEQPSNESSSLTQARSISKKSNKNIINLNGCTSSNINSNNKQGNSSRSFITNHSKLASADSESDDDTSCLEVKTPVEIIELSSDSEESVINDFKNEHINDVENEKLHYCSICQKKNILNHDCSQYNKSFFTCLVPNCNIISRSKKDFTPHYRRHIGLSSTAVMCRRCYQEIKKSDRDVNGYCHIRCRTVNLFKCYACNVIFNSMEEFAYHKLKTHNGRLMNSYGNYLCFYCEISSPDLTNIIEHTKHCLENQSKNGIEYDIKLKAPTENVTALLPVKKSNMKNILERKKGNETKIPRSSTHILFTCLKPSCNLIFQNFNVFKFHHRQHFGLGNKLMCWQCCVPFSGLNGLRAHQVKGNCRTPGMFKCYECSEQFDDLQSLSIHKYTLHNGDLIASKKHKTVSCTYCHVEIHIHNLKSHLITCQYNEDIKNVKIKPKSTYTKKCKSSYQCIICNKMCLTAAALTSHVKIHNPSPPKKTIKKRMSNTSLRTGNYFEESNSSYNREADIEINQSSSSQHDTNESINNDMANTGENTEMDVEMNTDNLSNEAVESVNYGIFPIVNKFIKCINCPRKFKSNSGLARHRQSCFTSNSLKNIPHNYYCTKCKKYFTRLTFVQHWRIHHGKRLQYHKFKRYSCRKCSLKFVYKIALAMHNEHVHGEENTIAITSNITPTNCVVMLPVISETTSLAKSISETTTENNEENNGPIKQEANTNTLSDQWEMTNNDIKENIIEHNTIEGNNEVNDLKSNEEQDISNNNDDREDETNVYTAQNINHIIEKLNDSEAIENLLFDEDTLAVNNISSMDVSESDHSYFDKTITKIDNNETSLSSIKEKQQNCLNTELVAINETQNVNHANENKTNNSIQEFPTSSN
ncbi:LOW QUALITY PROTEIN: zinc finger protein 184-like [Rhopalosiphum maidis]|uniref:LOW QUALITY PROTEIN: zinc finger protein 184-like n=1 Tax=Rhopalosiphum maidis TaxID=43146 RepID=UPI000EFF919A|nr:LOW QUALITY PROTEIN: zinc finger protein 184-like [Rhopalosiphum maidis]